MIGKNAEKSRREIKQQNLVQLRQFGAQKVYGNQVVEGVLDFPQEWMTRVEFLLIDAIHGQHPS